MPAARRRPAASKSVTKVQTTMELFSEHGKVSRYNGKGDKGKDDPVLANIYPNNNALEKLAGKGKVPKKITVTIEVA